MRKSKKARRETKLIVTEQKEVSGQIIRVNRENPQIRLFLFTRAYRFDMLVDSYYAEVCKRKRQTYP